MSTADWGTEMYRERANAVAIERGEEDISIEMSEAETTVETMPNARLEPVPEAGHSSNLENPEASNAAIRAFLEDVY